MPLATDPEQRIEICLEQDKHIDEAKRPTFVFHFMTIRESRRWREVYERISPSGNSEELLQAMWEVVSAHMVDWRNLTLRGGEVLPFPGSDNLDVVLEDLLHAQEVAELFMQLQIHNRLGGVDAKKFESASPSSSDGSVDDADPENATTDPTPQARSSESAPSATAPDASPAVQPVASSVTAEAATNVAAQASLS